MTRATSFLPTMSDPSAVWQARFRQRRKGGKVVLQLEVDESATIWMLLCAGMLDPTTEANDREALTVALQKQIDLLNQVT